jgi:hypothetical protein
MGGVRASRKLVLEAPSVRSLFWLASAERKAGHAKESAAALKRMLAIAERTGDLDRIVDARRLLGGDSSGPSGDAYRSRFDVRLRAALPHGSSDTASGYAAIRKLKVEALRRGGRATAIECVVHLISVAALARDVSAGLRFARELVAMEASSFSLLALALGLERVGRVSDARAAFARTLQRARAEGDIHRATKATAGLLRTRGEALVRRADLLWTMPEAVKEPPTVPDYLYLRATLGYMGAGR